MTIAAPSRNGTHRRYDVEAVRQAAIGRWLLIFLAAGCGFLAEAVRRGLSHGPCPGCGGTDRFRFFGDVEQSGGGICSQCAPRGLADGFAVLMHFLHWDFPTALSFVAEFCGVKPIDSTLTSTERQSLPTLAATPVMAPTTTPRPSTGQATPAADDHGAYRQKQISTTIEIGSVIRKFNEIWQESLPDHPRVSEYLAQSRGLSGSVPGSLRFHDSIPIFDGKEKLGEFPAMLARVQNIKGVTLNLHRTLLDRDGPGKARIENPKRLCRAPWKGATIGCAIRVFPVPPGGEELALCEGVEDAIAIHESLGLPCWACISATFLERVEIPMSIKRLLIFADADPVGIAAANALAERLANESREASVVIPTQGGNVVHH